MTHSRHILLPFALLLLASASSPAWSQVTTKPDGVFRSLLGLAASVSSGNTRASAVTLSGEGVRQTDRSKWSLAGRAIYARSDEGTTASSLALGTQYDRDLDDTDFFSVAKLDYLRDRPSNIDARLSGYGGIGRHFIRNDTTTWDGLVALGYTEDNYVAAADVAGESRTRYGRAEAVLSESSTHKLSETTRARQKFEWYPNLQTRGEYRAMFDASLSVAMTDRLELTTGVLYRYNSDPGVGLKTYDSLFVTAIALRFD